MATTAHGNFDSFRVFRGPGRTDILESFNYADNANYHLREGHKVIFKIEAGCVGQTDGSIGTSLPIPRNVEVRGAVDAIKHDLRGSIESQGIWVVTLSVASLDVKELGKSKHYDVKGYSLPISYNPDTRSGEVCRSNMEDLRQKLQNKIV